MKPWMLCIGIIIFAMVCRFLGDVFGSCDDHNDY